MEELCQNRKTQAESMTRLTKTMTIFLAKSTAGEPTGGSDKDRRRGRCVWKEN